MDLQEALEIEKISETRYKGKHCLSKPHPTLPGVYGGNMAAQALLVAIRSSPKGFTPHSLHSFFLKAGSDQEVFTWEVDKTSDGRTFCNRIIKGVQSDGVKYVATISLTKRNSVKGAENSYREYQEQIKNNKEEIDNLSPVAKPFGFGRPYPKWLSKYDPDSLPVHPRVDNRQIVHKLPPEMTDLELTAKEEEGMPFSERQLSFFVKWGKKDNNELPNLEEFRVPGLAVLSDSLFLTRLARLLRIPDLDHTNIRHYFSVSLDHIMYFHDVDYDPTKWMGFSFNAMRLSNNRVLLEGEMYNDKGQHVVSIIQEGLVKFDGLENKAKL
ncbi:peroxisomal acyl-coenzyme A thioester hydrolase 1 [[Candida] anglica]|uniref:Peroxisomal acyl-coenzyme A thioester hydrolase 1 n=1 Tax=[Candida] anglica TaxID=148631 RepID=A0ABP0EF47_9ASCO